MIEDDIQAGNAKPYHQEMLTELQNELREKGEEHLRISANWSEFNVSEVSISAIKYDIQSFLGLLDQDVPNPQLLHSIASKYISNLFINRDTEKVYLTLQITQGDKLLYEKTMVLVLAISYDSWRYHTLN